MTKLFCMLFLVACPFLLAQEELIVQTRTYKVLRVEGILVYTKATGVYKLEFTNGQTLQKALGYPKANKRIVLLIPQ